MLRTEEVVRSERLICKVFVSRFLGFKTERTGTLLRSERTYMKLKLIASSQTHKNQ